MKRYLLPLLLFFSFVVKAQIWEGQPYDSVILHFSDTMHYSYSPDTAAVPLWQIGRMFKPFFTPDTNGLNTIMTDTVNSYSSSADNWFTIKIPTSLPWHGGGYNNPIIGFWHRYETDSGSDGGAVEFSTDSGVTWQSVKGDCNIDGSYFFSSGIRTENFYTETDTIVTGVPAFSGKTNSPRFSRFQFSRGYLAPYNPTCIADDSFFIRFRFLSDTSTDTFAGWIIDSIKIEWDRYELSANNINFKTFTPPSPNPSNTGTFTFPPLKNEQQFTIEVYNPLGQKVVQTPYKHTLDISHLPKDLYFYKVTDGTEYYSGRLLYE